MVAVHGARRYEVRHLTRYHYSDALEAVYNRAFLQPRDTDHQLVLDTALVVVPEPDEVSAHIDYFGNRSSYLEARDLGSDLTVTCSSTVEVDWPEVDLTELDAHTVAEAAAELAMTADPVVIADFTLPSPLAVADQEVQSYARAILAPHRPLGQAIEALYRQIHSDFTYQHGATSVLTTLAELLELRRGVCQDFAHLAVGCLRAVGLPARYISGYLETQPPPGQEKLQGSDASHAWASVLTPAHSWVDLDPTNDQLADSRYIVTAWGRDFADVSPLRGIVFTEATTSKLNVEVDVIPLPE